MRTRHHYIPLGDAKVGMLLGAPADAVSGGAMSFSLPAGHTLTDDNLHHLLAHCVEFIFVDEPDTRADEEVAADAARVAGRLLRIFDGADHSDPNLSALFEQVLRYRNA
jgi:hypothetical protein